MRYCHLTELITQVSLLHQLLGTMRGVIQHAKETLDFEYHTTFRSWNASLQSIESQIVNLERGVDHMRQLSLQRLAEWIESQQNLDWEIPIEESHQDEEIPAASSKPET